MKRFRFHTKLALRLLVELLSGCYRSGATPQPTLTTTAAVPVLQGTIFCNNIRHGPKSGCRVQCLLAKGGLVCGYRDAGSVVSWSFLRHEDGKDIFRFESRLPGDKATATTQTYEIAYDGSLTMVFEDDVPRLVLDPSMTTEPRSK